MNNTTEQSVKYLVNCQDGANNIERATVAFILAVTASKTHEAAVFITADASDLCIKGGADGLRKEGYEPLADLIAQFVANGGKIWLCPICAKTRGFSSENLVAGVEIAGAPKTMAFLASGGKMLA